MIDNARIEQSHIVGGRAFQVYCAIASHVRENHRTFPGIKRLAEMTGLSERWVRKVIRALERAGWLCVDRTKGRMNSYALPSIESKEPEFPTPEMSKEPQFPTVRNPSSSGKEPEFLRVRNQSSYEEYETNKTNKEDEVKKTSSCPKLRFDEADMKTASWMFELIQALAPGSKKPNIDKWASDVRLMREQDHRTDAEIRSTFEWANADSFWKSNILSPAKLREKFTQLTIKMKSGANQNGKNSFPIGPGQLHPGSDRGIGVL